VAEQQLDGAHVGALLQRVRGKCMPQTMRSDARVHIRSPARIGDPASKAPDRDFSSRRVRNLCE
jgi:hypothetical protein